MMKKYLIAGLVLSLFFSPVQAQVKKLTFSAGPEVGFVADFNNLLWGFGIGGTAQVEFSLKNKINGTATAGFITYFGKSTGVGVKAKNVSVVPVRVGGRYYVSPQFYLGAQVGFGFMNFAGTSRTKFAYSPQVGYKFNTNNGKAIDASLKMDGYAGDGGTFNTVGLRVALEF